jgi:hypothetical protein
MIIKITPRKDGKFLVKHLFSNGRTTGEILTGDQLRAEQEKEYHPAQSDVNARAIPFGMPGYRG